MGVYITQINGDLESTDTINITFSDGTGLDGRRAKGDSYWFSLDTFNNSILFDKLGIKDKNEFVRKVVGYEPLGGLGDTGFPEVKSLADLKKVFRALCKVNKSNSFIKTIKRTSVKLNFKL